MSEAPTPSDPGTDPLAPFLDLRDSLRTACIGHGGRQVCAALTAALDQGIEDLLSPLPVDIAIVAVGGYGRGELSPYSDVDLMVLHAIDDPSKVAAALFRPLWDAKLRVGHSVRTVKEASAAAKERFDTQTTLLTGRFLVGDQDLFDRLMEEVATVTRARPLRRYLVSEERDRRRETPYLLMEANVKTGRGGLRTLQGFEWERRREELIGRFSADSQTEEGNAAETLLRIRNALHASAGRAHELFSADLREPASRWLGLELFDTASELVEALETVDRLASRRWPEVVDEESRGVWARLSGKPRPPSPPKRPTLDELVWLLESGESGRLGFERLWEAGVLSDLLPEWEQIRCLPQPAPFHEHPVAAHLWRTVKEMRALVEQDSHYGRIASELDTPEVLLLAAFLHDIGKGHGGDHATIGAGIARAFCERMGAPEDLASLVEGAVRHHLLLALTATRRDVDDPEVIGEVAATIGGLELLQVLYLLTVADSRATGTSMWSDWKATLVRTLFTRCAARFGADQPVETGTSRDEVLSLAGADRHLELDAHIGGMPGVYLRSVAARDVVWHMDLIAGLKGLSALGVGSDDPIGTAVVVGRSSPSFRRRVAEVFAANGIDVLEARLLTRVDGLIVDSFRVRDDRTGDRVMSEKWGPVRRDLEAGLLGELDTGSKVAARAAAYGDGSGPEPVVSGSIDRASGELVLTVKCSDRIGRLAEILGVLGEFGLDIRLAKIDSREGEVIDTFHVAAGAIDIASMERRLTAAISP